MSVTQRFYLACLAENNKIIGLYSNQKQMMDLGFSHLDMEDTYIKGSRKDKPVTAGNVSQGLTGRNLTIYKGGEPFIKVLVIHMNETNPEVRSGKLR